MSLYEQESGTEYEENCSDDEVDRFFDVPSRVDRRKKHDGGLILHDALINNASLDRIKTIIKNGARIWEYDSYGFEVLWLAISRSDEVAIEVIKLAKHIVLYIYITKQDISLLWLALINNRSPQVICDILKYIKESPNHICMGKTPLYWAIEQKKGIGIINALLDNGADVNMECLGQTPLFLSIENSSDVSIVSLLIKRGADVNREYIGQTPLKYAIKNNNSKDVIDMLRMYGGCIYQPSFDEYKNTQTSINTRTSDI